MKKIKYLWKWAKKYIGMIILIIGINIVLQYLFSYLPLFVQYAFKVLGAEDRNDVNLPKFIIDIFNISSKPLYIILSVGISMVVLQGIRSILRFINNYNNAIVTESISKDMKTKLYDKMVDLSYSYHNSADTGDLIQRSTSDVTTSARFITGQFPELVNIFVTIFIGAYQVYKINPILMGVSLIIVPISGIASVIFFRYVNKAFKKVEEKEAALTTIIQENINNTRIVKAFSNESYEFEKMDEANKKYSKEKVKFSTSMAFFWAMMDGVVCIQYGLTVVVGIILSKKGLVDSADIAAALLLMNMLVWPMRGLGRIIAGFGKSIVACGRIEEVLENESEFDNNGTLTPEIKGNIKFNHTSFKFPDDNNAVLNDISFDIKAGEVVAIVGKTGSGKSTICNLLTRMLDYEGSIMVDGVELKDIEKKHLRKQIRFVLQDPFLYSKTIFENLTIANRNVSKEKVKEACEIANVIQEINDFENGFDTMVGEKGTTLSGGQKQRISIARILVDDAPVIIFDDSLSALDNETDLMIRRSLRKKNKNQTMIIVTHRTTTAKEADKIVVLEDGVVKEIGTHDELKDKTGLYKELWEIQGSLYDDFLKSLGGDDNE